MSQPVDFNERRLRLSLLRPNQALLLARSEGVRVLISLQRILTARQRTRELLLISISAHHCLLAQLSQFHSLLRTEDLQDACFS